MTWQVSHVSQQLLTLYERLGCTSVYGGICVVGCTPVYGGICVFGCTIVYGGICVVGCTPVYGGICVVGINQIVNTTKGHKFSKF
jgi:hypothetical protein